MEKEFVPYKIALALKELGFDEPSFGRFYIKPKCKVFSVDEKGRHYQIKNTPKKLYTVGEYFVLNDDNVITAPTFSQAFRWFREKHGLRNSITDFIDNETGIEWDYEIAIIGTDIDERGNYKPLIDYSTDDETRKFKTYEEAELACLKKLIEIVKKQTE